MQMIPASGLEEAMELAAEMLPSDYAAYVIPEGGTILPVFKEGFHA
jgi:hypothetical protein